MRNAIDSGQRYELAILDLHMPQMDGLALAREIQADAALSDTQLMMLSSACIVADQAARARAGIRRYLNKPVRRADLQNALLGLLASSPPAESAGASSIASSETSQLTGHVLLVEDNDINQLLAEAMLQKLGVTWVLASNGAEAVEAVRQQAFDVILMDCQMPVMDGFEATAHIRALPDATKAAVPIVALTANAMQGDDQACLEAGMNRFLGKPYSLQALHAALSEWIKPQAPSLAGTADTGQTISRVIDDIVMNPDALQTLRDLDETGSDALLKRIVTSFLAAADGQMEKLGEAVLRSDCEAVRQTAHAWKSSAANLGADSLAALLKDVEQCSRQNRLEEAGGLIIEARVLKDRTAAALGELLKSLS
jgi:CheY-like chemotaxis protein